VRDLLVTSLTMPDPQSVDMRHIYSQWCQRSSGTRSHWQAVDSLRNHILAGDLYTVFFNFHIFPFPGFQSRFHHIHWVYQYRSNWWRHKLAHTQNI